MIAFSGENQLRVVYREPHGLRHLISALLAVALALVAALAISGRLGGMPADAAGFLAMWLVLALLVNALVSRWNFVTGFLIGLLSMVTAWRIAGLFELLALVFLLSAVFAAYLATFLIVAVRSTRQSDPQTRLSRTDWHLTFIRIYVGFDLIPHFTEKLFAGAALRADDIQTFMQLNVPDPEAFVLLAGLCELGIAIGIGIGVLARLAACCAALYFLVATLLGQHFLVGFIWALPGGGWEYPLLMTVLLLTFVVEGAGPFSVDAVVRRYVALPGWVRRLMVPRRA